MLSSVSSIVKLHRKKGFRSEFFSKREEILDRKLHFFASVNKSFISCVTLTFNVIFIFHLTNV